MASDQCVSSPNTISPKPCHNCRRQRLKCDRKIPHCQKCSKRGQECLGYQGLWRWEQGVASRGKMAGLTFDEVVQDNNQTRSRHPSPLPSLSRRSSRKCQVRVLPLRLLKDPLIQDLGYNPRRYLAYFATNVCRDLVLYDVPKHNPFRELIPLARDYPILLQIIIANSALHMSNTRQKSSVSDKAPLHHRTSYMIQSNSSQRSSELEPYRHALVAKQHALQLLKDSLSSLSTVNVDVTLAVVLLFIEFELIDSGKNDWKHHVNGARTLISNISTSSIAIQSPMSPLRSCLVSNCLVFDILGSTLASSIGLVPSDESTIGALSLLQDAEGNHCSSFPAVLLQLIRSAAQLLQPDHTSSPPHSPAETKQSQALRLLRAAEQFDPSSWATYLQSRSPAADLSDRILTATAHRAAVCIYLSRAIDSLDTDSGRSNDLEILVDDVISHASSIRPGNPLFTAITWPAFIAGMETRVEFKQRWVEQRFHELWEVEPWGIMRGALEVLERMWARRRHAAKDNEKGEYVNWISELKGEGVDWLII